MVKIFKILNKPSKKFAKDLILMQKLQNFAESGHTGYKAKVDYHFAKVPQGPIKLPNQVTLLVTLVAALEERIRKQGSS